MYLKTSFLILILSFLFFGCAPKETVINSEVSKQVAITEVVTKSRKDIPAPPQWREPLFTGTNYKSTYTAVDVFNRIYHEDPSIWRSVSDSEYTIVSYKWIEDMCQWMWKLENEGFIKYRNNLSDCEDYTLLFYVGCILSAGESGKTASPAIARVTIRLPNGNQRHAMIGAATDRGFYIVEPQPSAGPFRMTKYSDFKGDKVISVIFGDFNPPGL